MCADTGEFGAWVSGFTIQGLGTQPSLLPFVCFGLYLTESVNNVVFAKVDSRKSISAQICQLTLDISNSKGLVDGFVREPTFAKRLYKNFRREKFVCFGFLDSTAEQELNH